MIYGILKCIIYLRYCIYRSVILKEIANFGLGQKLRVQGYISCMHKDRTMHVPHPPALQGIPGNPQHHWDKTGPHQHALILNLPVKWLAPETSPRSPSNDWGIPKDKRKNIPNWGKKKILISHRTLESSLNLNMSSHIWKCSHDH